MTRPGRRGAKRGRSPEREVPAVQRLQGEGAGSQPAPNEARVPPSLQHDISVYQEELLIQNEALVSAQSALEETRDRFIELYDCAPTGYLTLDRNGVVRECNLTAAAMVGRSKAAFGGLTLLRLVHPDDRPAMTTFLRRCREGRDEQIEAEFVIRTASGPRHVQLLCRARAGQSAPTEFFASMIDVTERRMLEREAVQLARERAALANLLLSAQEEERRQIARNLHDDLGQQVTALRLTLEQLLAEASDESLRPRLTQLQRAIRRLDASLHAISTGLRPATLELGIVPAVGQLVDEWSAASGLEVTFQADDVPTGWLTPDVETQTFRILQEALTNVVKHAAASRVSVVLRRVPDGIRLAIEDDGRGFDVEAARAEQRGLGLVGMRERVQLVGGRLHVARGADRGTVITVMVPRAAAAR